MPAGSRPAMPPPPPKKGLPTPSNVSLSNQSQVRSTVLAAPVAQKAVSFRPDSQLSREGSYPAASVLSDASTGASSFSLCNAIVEFVTGLPVNVGVNQLLSGVSWHVLVCVGHCAPLLVMDLHVKTPC
jgi:hypothetical protein